MISVSIRIAFLLIIINSCDKQSNPFLGDNPILEIENMQGESRDVLVIEDFNLDCSLFNNEQCQLNDWCNYEDEECVSISKDILIVANQYNEGLVIYEISNDQDIQLNEIYINNSFEVLDNISLENDLELRKLVYSQDTKFLYVLDKFEYVYRAWLPGLLDQYSCPGEQTLAPYQLNPYDGVSNYHTTQIIIDQSNINNIDEVLLLFKYNENNISQQNLEGLASSTTSCSKFGVNSLSPDFFGNDVSCDNGILNGLAEFNPYASPLFDYNISDVYFNNEKIYIANPYDQYILKDSNGNKLDINYYNSSDNIINGCDLPENTISFIDTGDLLYNIESNIGYFEFNFYGYDLMDMYSEECVLGPNNYFIKCLTGLTDELGNFIFEGDINSKSFEIMISGNKMIGNLSNDSINVDNNCGTLISIDSSVENEISLFNNDFHSISIYDFVENGLIEFNQDFKTNSKVNSLYTYNDYIIAGTINEGCYITLLDQGGHNINDMPIFGSENFTINNIYYNQDNDLLLLSCGRNGVLIYRWDGLSGNALLLNHIVSSHSYSAKIYNDSYVIIATKYGVEIYNYEIN